MEYLLDDDLYHALEQADLVRLDAYNPLITIPAEQLALAEVRRELNAFDWSQALAAWQTYSASNTYQQGDRIYVAGNGAYYALQPVPAGIDFTQTAYWAAGDNRPKELVEVVLRLMLSHLAARMGLGPSAGSITAKAADARAWLQAQAHGTAQALLPRLANSVSFAFGSVPPRYDGGTIW